MVIGRQALLGAGLWALCLSAFALTNQEMAIFNNEPPVIKSLLERASNLEASDMPVTRDNEWQAANLYCEAARYGSAEGLYRLGMLYAFGRGVPESRDYAANLFGLAAMHGHQQAQKMLETIKLHAIEPPPCVLAAVAPARAPVYQSANFSGSPDINHYIARLPENKRWIVDMVNTIANWYQVDAKLALSIIMAESNFKVMAKSNKDAQGLMQLIPATAARFNIKNAYNASQNIKGGVAYLRWLLSYFRGDVVLTVAAYNAGEGAVDKYRGVPPYQETRAYVRKVMALYQSTRHDYDATIAPASPALRK